MEFYLLVLLALAVIIMWILLPLKEDDIKTVEDLDKSISEMLKNEFPSTEEMMKMTKAQIAELAEKNGVKLDQRRKKVDMISQFQNEIK